MFEKIKKFIIRKKKRRQFSAEEYEVHAELKKEGLEKILGKMYGKVLHAIIPFHIGGAVDLYFFTETLEGTGIVTMELIDPDGSGPQPSQIGTYELLAFKKQKLNTQSSEDELNKLGYHLRNIFTTLGRYSYEAELNPLETVEVPLGKGQPHTCLILDEFKKEGTDFMIGKNKHGLLLVIEIYHSEMKYAIEHGGEKLLEKLKEKGYYPYSDLDRDPVV